MTLIVNTVMSIVITGVFLLAIACNLVVQIKYKRMMNTMENKGRDKHLLKIERAYRHAYLKDRTESLDVFTVKEYYNIRILNIPIHFIEELAFSSIYVVTVLGIAFSLILLALPRQSLQGDLLQIFLLSIEGLVFGLILRVAKTFFCLEALKEIFLIQLSEYLGYELELFDEVERDEEGHLFFHKDYKENPKVQEVYRDHDNIIEFRSNSAVALSDIRETTTEELEQKFDEKVLLQVLDEIFG